jgi:hypothetical protein
MNVPHYMTMLDYVGILKTDRHTAVSRNKSTQTTPASSTVDVHIFFLKMSEWI